MRQSISIALAFVVCLAGMACSGAATPVEYSNPCRSTATNLSTASSLDQQSVPSQSAPIPPRGDQAQIAFVSDRSGDEHIYLMNADGSGLTDLTGYPGDHGYPVWSPDGNNLVYVNDSNNGTGIALKKVDGNHVELADGKQPAWSPDGKSIAFVTDRDYRGTPVSGLAVDLREAIHLVNADGSNQTRLSLGDVASSGEAPAWSPDGKYIAYVEVPSGLGLFIMTSGGSHVTRLGTGDVFPTQPVWSPDGRKIAYSINEHSNSSSSNDPRNIYVIDADGSHRVRLTSGSRDESPAWSPDGKKIAFFSDRDGNNQIYVMNADGSGVRRLTKDTLYDFNPTWSPDGSMIAYHSVVTGCLRQVCVMTTSGRVETCTRGAATGGDPEVAMHTAWRPNHSP